MPSTNILPQVGQCWPMVFNLAIEQIHNATVIIYHQYQQQKLRIPQNSENKPLQIIISPQTGNAKKPSIKWPPQI